MSKIDAGAYRRLVAAIIIQAIKDAPHDAGARDWLMGDDARDWLDALDLPAAALPNALQRAQMRRFWRPATTRRVNPRTGANKRP